MVSCARASRRRRSPRPSRRCGRAVPGFPPVPPAELTPALRRELPLSARDLGLTDRQGQVLALMLRGLPNKQIAKELAISEQTTKEHVTAILGKLGVSNRVEAITLLHGRRLEP